MKAREQYLVLGLTLALFLAAGVKTLNGAENAELFRTTCIYSSGNDQKRYEVVVRESDVNQTPPWRTDQVSPPLAPGSAVQIARERLIKVLPECKDPRLHQINLMPAGQGDKWIYVVAFDLASEQSTTPSSFSVPVLMNGQPVEPKLLNPGEEKEVGTLEFQGVLVIQALQLYKLMAGAQFADLKIEKDVPLTARISLSSRSVSQEEALRLMEKALREQAGVVVTRIDTNQFSVTYDESVKKGP